MILKNFLILLLYFTLTSCQIVDYKEEDLKEKLPVSQYYLDFVEITFDGGCHKLSGSKQLLISILSSRIPVSYSIVRLKFKDSFNKLSLTAQGDRKQLNCTVAPSTAVCGANNQAYAIYITFTDIGSNVELCDVEVWISKEESTIAATSLETPIKLENPNTPTTSTQTSYVQIINKVTGKSFPNKLSTLATKAKEKFSQKLTARKIVVFKSGYDSEVFKANLSTLTPCMFLCVFITRRFS